MSISDCLHAIRQSYQFKIGCVCFSNVVVIRLRRVHIFTCDDLLLFPWFQKVYMSIKFESSHVRMIIYDVINVFPVGSSFRRFGYLHIWTVFRSNWCHQWSVTVFMITHKRSIQFQIILCSMNQSSMTTMFTNEWKHFHFKNKIQS